MSHQHASTGLEPGERLTFWITVTSMMVTLVCAIGVITLLLTIGESPVVMDAVVVVSSAGFLSLVVAVVSFMLDANTRRHIQFLRNQH